MTRQLRTFSIIVILMAFAVCFIITDHAEAVIMGDFDFSSASGSASGLFDVLSVAGASGTNTLTTGAIWDELNTAGISEAWALEFILNTNEAGASDTGIDVTGLKLTIGNNTPLDLVGTAEVSYDSSGGASSYEAKFRTKLLPFDFMTEYADIPANSAKRLEEFILAATHDVLTISDGPDVYSLSPVTVTPEPISTVLFLLGGAPMAAALYRKKRKL